MIKVMMGRDLRERRDERKKREEREQQERERKRFFIFEIARRQKMKKYNPHSNRPRSRLVPAPKSQKPLIVAAGTIRAGTVIERLLEHILI